MNGDYTKKARIFAINGDCTRIKEGSSLVRSSFVSERLAPFSKAWPAASTHACPGLLEGIRGPLMSELGNGPELAGAAAITVFYRDEHRKTDARAEMYGELVERIARNLEPCSYKTADGAAFFKGVIAAAGKWSSQDDFLLKWADGGLLPFFMYDVGRRLEIDVQLASADGRFYVKTGNWIFSHEGMMLGEENQETLQFSQDASKAKYGIYSATADRNFYIKGDYHAAFELYMDAAKISPHDSWTQHQIGASLVLLGKPGEAIRHYEKALKLETKAELLGIYLIDLANARLECGGISQLFLAREDCDKAVAADRSDEQAYLIRAKVMRKLGWPQEALDDYSRAIGINPDIEEAYGERGELNYILGNFSNAAEDFKARDELRECKQALKGKGNP